MGRGLRAAIAGVAGLAAVGIGIPVFAATNAPIAQTGGATVEIPLLGTGLTVTVALDTTTGDITSVNLDNPTGFVATKDSPQRVRFEKGTDGTTSVSVSAKRAKMKIGVKTTSLDDLLANGGKGSWKADVFGTKQVSVVPYTIGKDANGGPTLTLGDITPIAGITATPKTTTGDGKFGDEGDHQEARAWVVFEHDGFRKVLTISVSVGMHEDGTPGAARLSFVLTGRDVQRKPLADLAGDKTWKGQLCDGTPASIDYNVGTDGTLTVKMTTPTADVMVKENRAVISFPAGDKVLIRLRTPDSGDASVSVNVFGRHCEGTRPSVPPPSVNTPTSLAGDSGSGSGGDHHGKEHDGKNGGSHGGDG
jgi:hypothetical protein